MKTLRKKIMAGEFDLINTKVTYCGEGTWFLQEYSSDNRATGGASVYRNEFDVTPEDDSFDAFFIACYTPALIGPVRNSCVTKDKRSSRLRMDVVKSITCTRPGTVKMLLENGREYSFRMQPGEYLFLTPRV